MSNVELLPCPICGSNGVRTHITDHFIPDWYTARVVCGKCGLMIEREGYPIDDAKIRAIGAWNTRHQIPCETCSQMGNPDSFISHLMQANVWELKDIIRRIESEVLDTLSDDGDDWFASSKVYDAIEIIKEYIEN